MRSMPVWRKPEMKPTISMSVWRRPEYTKMVLDALRDNYLASRYQLVVAVDCEGAKPNPEVMAILKEQTWPTAVKIIEMPGHCGCNRTIHAAMSSAFEDTDYVIHIEDDVVLARDGLAWFEWAGEQWQTDPSVFTITAWRHPSGWLPESGQPRPAYAHEHVQRESFFTCWGWATWRDRWATIEPAWSKKSDFELSWDVQMSALRGTRVQLAPHVGRASNIGAMKGTHRGHVIQSYWRGDDKFVAPSPYFVEVQP